MSYRRYYRRSNYRTKEKKIFDFFISFFILLFIFLLMTYYYFIKPYLNNIILFLKIFVPIIIIIIGLIIFYKIKKNNEKIKNLPNELLKIKTILENHKPLKPKENTNNKEQFYQNGLYQYLNTFYPDIENEKMKDETRPDLIINNNIAVEIKGPTDMNSLKTLLDKVNSYVPKWDYLIIILFDIQMDNKKYEYKIEEIKNGIPENKKDKVIIIKK